MAYLDNCATTPVCAAAAEAASRAISECWANPSSLHLPGIEAGVALGHARRQVAKLLGCRPDEIIFTGGGTEANNLAIIGAAQSRIRSGRHIVATAIEHASVLAALAELEKRGFSVTLVPPDTNGHISVNALISACRADTVLAAVMAVNHETGLALPLEEMIPALRRTAPLAHIHCDAVQAAGKIPVSADRSGADTLSVSAHKLHGVKGCGALYLRKGVRIIPQSYGGHQERGLRCGTEATPLIAAFGAAAQAVLPFDRQDAHFRHLRERLTQGLRRFPGITVNSPPDAVPYIFNFSTPGFRSQILLNFLSERGVHVSSGSACSAGKVSSVLTAMKLPDNIADSALRLGFSHMTEESDIDLFLSVFELAVSQIERNDSNARI